MNQVEVFDKATMKWVQVPACPVCDSPNHSAHCGRCNRPLVKTPTLNGETIETCPICTTRIGRW